VVGGAGHVGLPLSILFASKGIKTSIFDLSEAAVEKVNRGQLPFIEPGATGLLEEALAAGNLSASTNPESIAYAEIVIVVIGTPVDEHLNPDPNTLTKVIAEFAHHLRDGQLIILRSTIYPGVTQAVNKFLSTLGLNIDLAFCPERIAEHHAVEELVSLPQIVSGTTKRAEERAAALFRNLTEKIVVVSPEEAELAKLFTNTWRYVKFALANQFFMFANDRGLDYERIRYAISKDYPRAKDIPSAGFAAGPCLFKDTMQLSAFSDNKFALGHSAMLINEGLPLYVVRKLEEKYADLQNMTVGILGMSFKGGSDDIRSSLSYKLKKILEFKAGHVLCSDPFVTKESDYTLVSQDLLFSKSDLIIIATPHNQYREIETTTPVIDIWGLLGKGAAI
jgi:UDP-N-acetyl-D-mannosaminuronic acid dehydrogenase